MPEIDGIYYSFTQPICRDCYERHEPGRVPSRLKRPEEERCCDCGSTTRDGIYYRIDPRTVQFPKAGEQ